MLYVIQIFLNDEFLSGQWKLVVYTYFNIECNYVLNFSYTATFHLPPIIWQLLKHFFLTLVRFFKFFQCFWNPIVHCVKIFTINVICSSFIFQHILPNNRIVYWAGFARFHICHAMLCLKKLNRNAGDKILVVDLKIGITELYCWKIRGRVVCHLESGTLSNSMALDIRVLISENETNSLALFMILTTLNPNLTFDESLNDRVGIFSS